MWKGCPEVAFLSKVESVSEFAAVAHGTEWIGMCPLDPVQSGPVSAAFQNAQSLSTGTASSGPGLTRLPSVETEGL